ncbi:hypothetical protein [Plastoroseomonas arctica]|uniref:Uncharacterized protein n=1 Tax=Plastoroseomonas arctica TaxID=1509237 RepID=A0AAF1JZU2_9PROT|nr:hypothetical protein [Plastoroseomonas arctica]MBR0654588.1 hypothetical protein [Plastoroseomonas arctica]
MGGGAGIPYPGALARTIHEDGDASRDIDTDLDEMEAMIDSTLAYLPGETETEPCKPADLVAMIETLCHAAADSGAAVTYAGPAQARLVCSPGDAEARLREPDR